MSMNNTQIELDLASARSSQETIFLREMARGTFNFMAKK